MGVPFEKLLIVTILVVAFGAIGMGYHLAMSLGDAHWLNRAGALIVAAEALLLFAELSRRARLREVEDRYGQDNPYIAAEVLRAERRLVAIAATMIVLGELLHGFGDLAFGLVRGLTHG